MYANGDHDFGADSEHLIGRRFVVTDETKFSEPIHHPFPLGYGRPAEKETIQLPRGSVFRAESIQHYWADGIDGGSFNLYSLNAIVTTKPQQGTRIGIDYWKMLMPPGIAAAPLPEDRPSWLDVSEIPPKVRPILTADLAVAAREPDWANRYYALKELVRRAPGDSWAVSALAFALGDDLKDLQLIAINGLGSAGPAAMNAADALLVHLNNLGPAGYHPRSANFAQNMKEQEATEQALAAMGPKIYPRVAAMLASKDRGEVDRAATILGYAGPSARAQVPQLEAAMRRDPDWTQYRDFYSSCFHAIEEIDPGRTIQILIPDVGRKTSLGNSYNPGSEICVIYSAGIDDRIQNAALAAFTKASTSPDEPTRQQAIANLQWLTREIASNGK
jgi:hypothetical protein